MSTAISEKYEAPEIAVISEASDWLRGLDLNQRPLGYEGISGHDPPLDPPIPH